MKLKNTKYILLLLAGIMLATGCGCGKGDGKGGAGADVTELEATEKKLLDELKPLFIDWKKALLLSENQATKEFEAEYTDTERLSFKQELKIIKDVSDNSCLTSYLTKVMTEMGRIADRIKTIADMGALFDAQKKEKLYTEKRLDLYKNRAKIVETLLGIDTKNNDNK